MIVLCIDDDPDDTDFFCEALKTASPESQCLVANDGLTALKMLRSDSQPDIIFLDINMPGMNGWEFLDEYNKLDKQLQSRAVVVMLTTSDNPDDKTKAMALNVASDFKTKPLTGQMLREIISTYLKD